MTDSLCVTHGYLDGLWTQFVENRIQLSSSNLERFFRPHRSTSTRPSAVPASLGDRRPDPGRIASLLGEILLATPSGLCGLRVGHIRTFRACLARVVLHSRVVNLARCPGARTYAARWTLRGRHGGLSLDAAGRCAQSGGAGVVSKRTPRIDTFAVRSGGVSPAVARWPVVMFLPSFGAPFVFYASLVSNLASYGVIGLAVPRLRRRPHRLHGYPHGCLSCRCVVRHRST